MSDQLALLGGPKAVTLPYPKYPVIDAEEVCAATRVVMSGMLSDPGRGEVVARFEDDFAAYFGAKYALGCSSGTAAIHSALFAVGVRPGDEVLTANHNWISAIMAIFHAGAAPVLCDVKADSFSLDPAEIRRKATPRTKAVTATHLWGIPADMDGILAEASALGLPVIEDVSHAHGGKYKGQYLGTIGEVGCFSLQGSKAIVAGEGGVLVTNDERCYQRALVPGNHPMRLGQDVILDEVKPFAAAGGMHMYRIPTISAAIATAQLRKLDTLNAARQANFDRLRAGLADLLFITWPALDEGSVRGWYGAPAFYDAEKAGAPRDRFVQACQVEGAGLAGEGYCDWSQTPILRDPGLLARLFTIEHATGAAYRPIEASSLPNNQALRRRMLLFTIPAVECPALMDQVVAALHKVAAEMDAVAAYEPVTV